MQIYTRLYTLTNKYIINIKNILYICLKQANMKMVTKTITIPDKVWEKGVKASEEVFGKKNFSGHVQQLVLKDAKKRNIKNGK